MVHHVTQFGRNSLTVFQYKLKGKVKEKKGKAEPASGVSQRRKKTV